MFTPVSNFVNPDSSLVIPDTSLVIPAPISHSREGGCRKRV